MKSKIFFILKLNIFKSIYYSIRMNGWIFVGRHFDLNIHKGAKIQIKCGQLSLGVNTTYKQAGTLDMYKNSLFVVNGNVSIYKGCKIMIGEDAQLSIGNNTYINEHSRIQCREYIEIGSNCAVSWLVDILDTDEHIIDKRKSKYKPVRIGNHVWIGTKVTVLKGSVLESGVVIGANSLVTGVCKSNGLYVGNPCKLMKEEISWQ